MVTWKDDKLTISSRGIPEGYPPGFWKCGEFTAAKVAQNKLKRRRYYAGLKRCGLLIIDVVYYINWKSDDWDEVVCNDCARLNGLIW